jgi:hypothetical protein
MRRLSTYVVAPPNGRVVRTANTTTVTGTGAVSRLTWQIAEVVGTIVDCPIFRFVGKIVADFVASFGQGPCNWSRTLELEARIDLRGLRYHFLNCAV